MATIQGQQQMDKYEFALIPSIELDRIAIQTIKELGDRASLANIEKLLWWKYESPTIVNSVVRTIQHRLRKWECVTFSQSKGAWLITREPVFESGYGYSNGTVPELVTEHFCHVCKQSVAQFQYAEIIRKNQRWFVCHNECADKLLNAKSCKKSATVKAPVILHQVRDSRTCPRCLKKGVRRVLRQFARSYLYFCHYKNGRYSQCYCGRLY